MIKIASFDVEDHYALPKAFGFTERSIATSYLAAHADRIKPLVMSGS